MVAIAEHGSFAATARILNLSQSAVSLHIRTLESDLDCPLFDRSKRPPILSNAGTSTVARAKDLLGLAEEMRTNLSNVDQVRDRLQLGAGPHKLAKSFPFVLYYPTAALGHAIDDAIGGLRLAVRESRRLHPRQVKR